MEETKRGRRVPEVSDDVAGVRWRVMMTQERERDKIERLRKFIWAVSDEDRPGPTSRVWALEP